MPDALQLRLTDYRDSAHWRWVLTDAKGKWLADHEVSLPTDDPHHRGFAELTWYLNHYQPTASAESLLAGLGEWMGRRLFGGLNQALRERLEDPATVVRVGIPPQAQDLLFRPFELTRLDGRSLAECGVRFVYQLDDAPAPKKDKPADHVLRVLAIFSLPDDASPLNLRRERYQLQKLLRHTAQTHGAAIECRVLQYGATRQTLADALADGGGWDIIHFSGHGLQGELLLETDRGGMDRITADQLKTLLADARKRLKLLVLSACWSGAGSLQHARAQLGLDGQPTRQTATAATQLPSLGQTLSETLDCAVLAMRYPVGDEFAVQLALELYCDLLEHRQPLPAALQMALRKALAGQDGDDLLPLSPVTPILFGPRATDLTLIPPKQTPDFVLPRTGLFNFDPEPERFVGRLMPMLRATQTLARESSQRGVLFHGMAGAGKTTCATELAYRHEKDRFTGYVWYEAPKEGHDITTALGDFLKEMERQLDMHDLALTAHVDDPAAFKRRTLPRLRGLLEQHSVLIVLDNMESLLTSQGRWRDETWAALVEALLAHRGVSRVVLTSRRLPVSLKDHKALLREPIHALSLGETVLLAREMPHLRPLFKTEDGKKLLQHLLRAVQGHPKLLDLANGRASDLRVLERFLGRMDEEAPASDVRLDEFFAGGESKQDEGNFVDTLHAWTRGIVATVSPAAGLLFQFLCRLEDEDRVTVVIGVNWANFLDRIKDACPQALAALAEPDLGLDAALEELAGAGMIEARVRRAPEEEDEGASSPEPQTDYRIHPGVAEAGREDADATVLAAVDVELGNFWSRVFLHGRETEMQGGGRLIVESARRAAPYLMRARRWEEAATLLEQMLHRDRSPATLAMILPLLRRIARATERSERGLIDAGILATALLLAGRHAEAESMLRDVLGQNVARGNYRQASANAGHLLDLLWRTGRPQEALVLSEQLADYTRRAGLGPWTQLGDEVRRLQILSDLGRYREVLDTVESLRKGMKCLPEHSDAEEAIEPWNVREGLLDTGHTAALDLEDWETALELNAELLRFKQQRGADEAELARARFNDYSPLLRLGHLDEARALLEDCRAVFEQARDVAMLGKVFGALADLEDKEGNTPAAVRFQRVALRYAYQTGEPGDCAVIHHNLANCLERTRAEPEGVLAHRLANALICFQTESGRLTMTIRNLARTSLMRKSFPASSTPPAFDAVVEQVEQIEGVKFRDLFDRLPRRAPTGDAAIAAVWEMVREEQER